MNILNKKQTLLKKMREEQLRFKERILSLPTDEILEHSYAYATKEDIINALDYMDISEDNLDCLLNTKNPLDNIYERFCDAESEYMEILKKDIKVAANMIKKDGRF